MKIIYISILLIIIIISVFLQKIIYFTFYKNKKLNITFGYNKNSLEYFEPKIYKKFISHNDCKYIINKAKDKLVISNIMGLGGQKLNKQNLKKLKKYRNSEQMWINKSDHVYQKIIKKIQKIVNKDSSHFESLQVVRYKPGGYYNAHHDACCVNEYVCKNDIKKFGQRLYTFLICLDNRFTGGQTRFPNLNKSYKLNKGDALFFHTHDINRHKCHKNALHAGLPIKSGIKWICNIWVSDRSRNL